MSRIPAWRSSISCILQTEFFKLKQDEQMMLSLKDDDDRK